MESLPKSALLEFSPDLMMNVRRMYDLDKPGRMAEAVDILEEWLKKQEHFIKKDFPRTYLETLIVSSKGSLERAKSRLDKLCTFKTMFPKLFRNTNVLAEYGEILDVLCLALLPKLTKENYRVGIVKIKRTNFEAADFVKFLNCVFIVMEYLRLYDYAVGVILISDYSQINVSEVISKIGLIELQQSITIVSEGYGTRIKALNFITTSFVIDGFIKLVKQFVPEKIGKRINVLKNTDQMCEYVPKDILPVDYGGPERSCQELHDQLMATISSEDHVNFVKEMWNARTIESHRLAQVNDEYMGISGTFRSLTVD